MLSWKENVTQRDVLIACGVALFTLSHALFCNAQNEWNPHPDLERVLKDEPFNPTMVLFHPDTQSEILNGEKGSYTHTSEVILNRIGL